MDGFYQIYRKPWSGTNGVETCFSLVRSPALYIPFASHFFTISWVTAVTMSLTKSYLFSLLSVLKGDPENSFRFPGLEPLKYWLHDLGLCHLLLVHHLYPPKLTE